MMRHNVLGVSVHAATYTSAVDAILAAASEPRAFTVAAQPVHGIMLGVLDPEQRYRLNHFDLVVPDGQPVRWALNLLHRAGLRDRVYGPTLMLHLCERAAQTQVPVYFYGSRAETLQLLARRLTERFPGLIIAGQQPGQYRRVEPQEAEQISAAIRASGARLVFVALGCPRQEVWAYENRERLGVPIIAVGAAFDFHAGLVPQAPARLQALGLEWLFRLVQEPRRLWRRYVYLNPLYLLLVFLQWTGLRRISLDDSRQPAGELGFA
jgi:exopolysaccharide biosynthesis WecB/TagA/CpsF family protein